MTFIERLKLENNNTEKIIFFNDKGLFYNLLERSAYAFCTRIKPFKVNVKQLKGIDNPFVSIGVPAGKTDNYLHEFSYEKDEQKNIIVHLNEPINEQDFILWKENIIEQNINNNKITEPLEIGSDKPQLRKLPIKDYGIIRQCFQEVKLLNLASITPMDAILFLNNLQQQLKNIIL